jgi:hypothetical protein
MARDYAEQSSGNLEMDSIMGQGPCIRIILPLSRGSAGTHGVLGKMLHRSNAEHIVMTTELE